MALSEEERERVAEIERIKLEEQRKFYNEDKRERSIDMDAMFLEGGPAGQCEHCGTKLRTRYLYCIGCGRLAPNRCIWCSGRVPRSNGARFCPTCGKPA